MLTIENNSQRLYLQIATALAEMINRQDVKVGGRFPAERELAAKFEVSRSTIREAMIALEVSGIVEIRSGSGIYAQDTRSDVDNSIITEDTPGPFEVLEARILIESEAAEIAAERISNNELHQLKELLTAMDLAIDSDDIEEAERIDHAFHLVIIKATRNSALTPIYEWLWNIRESSAVSQQFHHKVREKGSTPSVNEHREVFDALMQRDGVKAKKAIKSHLSEVMKRLTACSLI
jgi:GntR family transcriptional repressor for pyruvate dehydrogenase complex